MHCRSAPGATAVAKTKAKRTVLQVRQRTVHASPGDAGHTVGSDNPWRACPKLCMSKTARLKLCMSKSWSEQRDTGSQRNLINKYRAFKGSLPDPLKRLRPFLLLRLGTSSGQEQNANLKQLCADLVLYAFGSTVRRQQLGKREDEYKRGIQRIASGPFEAAAPARPVMLGNVEWARTGVAVHERLQLQARDPCADFVLGAACSLAAKTAPGSRDGGRSPRRTCEIEEKAMVALVQGSCAMCCSSSA